MAYLSLSGAGMNMPMVNDNVQGTNRAQPNWWNTSAAPTRQVGTEYKPYYTNENPRAYWGQVGQGFGMGATFEDFWNRNYDKYQQQFLQWAEGKPDAQFPDFVTGALGDQVKRDFALQAPQARGIDPRLYDKGRFDTSY